MEIKNKSFVNRVITSSVSTLAVTVGSINQAHAVTFTENFNSVPTASYVSGNPIGQFTVTGSIPGTSQAADIVYDTFTNSNVLRLFGKVTSTTPFAFNPGSSATLSFDYDFRGLPQLFVNLGSSSFTINSPSNQSTFTTTIPNPTNGFLSFQSYDPRGGQQHTIIDNIKLSYNVPEPADFVGTAIAFGSVVMLKRNFSKKAK
jgi:hypothetical protein